MNLYGGFKQVAKILQEATYLLVSPSTTLANNSLYKMIDDYGVADHKNLEDDDFKDATGVTTLTTLLKSEYTTQNIAYMLVDQANFNKTYLTSFKAAAIAAESGAYKNLTDQNAWYALFLYYGLKTLPKIGNYLNVEMEEKMHPWAFNMPTDGEANSWAALYWITGPSNGNIQREAALYQADYKIFSAWTKK